MSLNKIRGNKNVRLVVLLLIIAAAAGLWYFSDSKAAKTAAIVGGSVAAVAVGLEVADTDFDLKKLWETGSLEESLLARDGEGNLVTEASVFCDAQAEGFYDLNCGDFLTHAEAQNIYDTCDSDINRLDGNNNGIVCESLPGSPTKN